MKTRIYEVTQGEKSRLVRASNKAQARNHAARASIGVELASQDRLVALMQSGTQIEDAATETEVE